jgi:hypothetical protein
MIKNFSSTFGRAITCCTFFDPTWIRDRYEMVGGIRAFD